MRANGKIYGLKRLPKSLRSMAIRGAFEKLPPDTKKNNFAEFSTEVEKAIMHPDRKIGLLGLKKPYEDMTGLELNCTTMDIAKSVAISGIEKFTIALDNEFQLRMLGDLIQPATGLELNGLVGPIPTLQTHQDYDFIIGSEIANSISPKAITRLLFANTRRARYKRAYFFEEKRLETQNLDFFRWLSEAGFTLLKTQFSKSWYAMVAKMKSCESELDLTVNDIGDTILIKWPDPELTRLKMFYFRDTIRQQPVKIY